MFTLITGQQHRPTPVLPYQFLAKHIATTHLDALDIVQERYQGA